MRICILCEEDKVDDVRKKTGHKQILVIPVSPSGNAPATHRFCSISVTEEKANKLVAKAEITTIEISEPLEFLEKWNLKIIE